MIAGTAAEEDPSDLHALSGNKFFEARKVQQAKSSHASYMTVEQCFVQHNSCMHVAHYTFRTSMQRVAYAPFMTPALC